MKHHLSETHANQQSPIHDLAPSKKLIMALSTILLLIPFSKMAEHSPVLTILYPLIAGALLLLTRRASLPLWGLFRKTLVVVPFVLLIVLLNATATGFQWFHLHLGLRSIFSVWILVLLISTTHLSDILGVLVRWRVPRVLLLTISFIYRYFFVLVDEYERMHLALKARGYSQGWLQKTRLLATITASLFIRSYERAERVHQAMVMRGFDGGLE